MKPFKIVIPSRYGAQRFPGKPLSLIAGKPMIQHVYEHACESIADEVWVATEDERIAQVVRKLNGNVAITSSQHLSGTTRIAEVAEQQGWSDDTIVVNLQGDEPLIPGSYTEQVAALLSTEGAPMASLYTSISSVEELLDPNIVKVVLDERKRALYFSRSTIPYDRQQQWLANPLQYLWNRHLGIYAYTVGFLKELCQLAVSPLEQLESLEQLRVLWHGYSIQMDWVERAYPSVDVIEDIALVEQRIGLELL